MKSDIPQFRVTLIFNLLSEIIKLKKILITLFLTYMLILQRLIGGQKIHAIRQFNNASDDKTYANYQSTNELLKYLSYYILAKSWRL